MSCPGFCYRTTDGPHCVTFTWWGRTSGPGCEWVIPRALKKAAQSHRTSPPEGGVRDEGPVWDMGQRGVSSARVQLARPHRGPRGHSHPRGVGREFLTHRRLSRRSPCPSLPAQQTQGLSAESCGGPRWVAGQLHGAPETASAQGGWEVDFK